MRQHPVGEPAATAARNCGTPRDCAGRLLERSRPTPSSSTAGHLPIGVRPDGCCLRKRDRLHDNVEAANARFASAGLAIADLGRRGGGCSTRLVRRVSTAGHSVFRDVHEGLGQSHPHVEKRNGAERADAWPTSVPSFVLSTDSGRNSQLPLGLPWRDVAIARRHTSMTSTRRTEPSTREDRPNRS